MEKFIIITSREQMNPITIDFAHRNELSLKTI